MSIAMKKVIQTIQKVKDMNEYVNNLLNKVIEEQNNIGEESYNDD